MVRRFGPARPDAGHVEGRHHSLRFAEIVPVHPGDFEHGEPFGFERKHLVREIHFIQLRVEFVDRRAFGCAAEVRQDAGKRSIQRSSRAMMRLPGLGCNGGSGARVRLSGTMLTFEVCEILIIIDVSIIAQIDFIAAGQVDFSVDQGADVLR